MFVSRSNLFFAFIFWVLYMLTIRKNKEYHQTYPLTKCFSCLTLTIVHFPKTTIFANLKCHMQILQKGMVLKKVVTASSNISLLCGDRVETSGYAQVFQVHILTNLNRDCVETQMERRQAVEQPPL